MEIRRVFDEKKQYLDLLLMADEQEDMVDRYLDRGEMYVLLVGEPMGVCVVTDEGGGVWEIKNIATRPGARGKGYGRALVEHVSELCARRGHTLQVGTGDSPLTLPFYERLGFVVFDRVKDFFVQNYDHPIFEAGVQLRDMVYLKKALGKAPEK